MHRRIPRLRPSGGGLTTIVATVALLGAVSVAPAAGQATGTIRGPDVASYQHPGSTTNHCGKPINWTKVAKDNVQFAIVKATEGTTYLNPCFDEDYAGSLAAGLVHGAYHFARPDTPLVGNATAQADDFADQLDTTTAPQTLPPALDLEVTGGLSRPQLITWTQAFLIRMHTDTGRVPMLYTYPTFWASTLGDPTAFAQFPLWMASYCHQSCKPPDATLYQYTPGGTLNGISGHVDLSKFLGTPDEWAALSDGTVVTPWRAAAPSHPRSVHAAATGAHTASVSWLPGNAGSARVSGYTVTAQLAGTPPVGAATSATANVGGATTTATVKGLTPGASYTFTVTATNSVGTSAASAPGPPLTIMVPTTIATKLPASIIDGDSASIMATLTRTDSRAPLVDRRIALSTRRHDQTSWQPTQVLHTDAHGQVSVTLQPTHNTDVQFAFAGTKTLQPASVVNEIKVRPAVAASLSKTTVKKGRLAILSGHVSPFVARQTVRREGHYAGGWHLWDTARLSNKGRFSFRIRPTTPVNVYRVVAVAVHHRAKGISRPVTLHAH